MRPSHPRIQTLFAAGLLLAGAGRAQAHKANSSHTHCAVDGKGVAVEGRTDAERKLGCGRIAGAVWDESKDLRIETPAPASAAPAPPKGG